MITVDFGHDRVAIEPRSRCNRTAIVGFFHEAFPTSDHDQVSGGLDHRRSSLLMHDRRPCDADPTVPRVSTYRQDETTIADHRGRVMKIVRSRAAHGEKRIAAYRVRPMEIVRLSR